MEKTKWLKIFFLIGCKILISAKTSQHVICELHIM